MASRPKSKGTPSNVVASLRKGGENPRNLLTSLILIFPLLLIYQLGVMFTLPMLNGADFVTTFLIQRLHLSSQQYLMFIGLVWAVFAVAMVALGRRQAFHPRVLLPVLLESSIYALSMGSLIILVMTKVLGVSPRLAIELASRDGGGIESQGLFTRIVMSLGAGVYEELVFRLGLLGSLAWALERILGWSRWVAVFIAVIASSVAFSAMHHIPPYGDPFTVGVFTFRVLAGVCFGALYGTRGLAVAVYTHALYDLYVLVLR